MARCSPHTFSHILFTCLTSPMITFPSGYGSLVWSRPVLDELRSILW